MTDVLAKELERERRAGQQLLEENITLRGEVRDIESHYCEMFNLLNRAARWEDWDGVSHVVSEMKRFIKEGSPHLGS